MNPKTRNHLAAVDGKRPPAGAQWGRSKAAQQQAMAPDHRFETSGELPDRLPHPAESVELFYADTALVGAVGFPLGMIVACVVDNEQARRDCRVHGYYVMPPGSTGINPQTGQQMMLPALMPILNCPYSRERKPLTWRFHGDYEDWLADNPQPEVVEEALPPTVSLLVEEA